MSMINEPCDLREIFEKYHSMMLKLAEKLVEEKDEEKALKVFDVMIEVDGVFRRLFGWVGLRDC
ncbi:MAG: hypothetical protein QXX41_08300 [Nitrososphaerota archaeon]